MEKIKCFFPNLCRSFKKNRKKWITVTMIFCMTLNLSACQFRYMKPSEVREQFDSMAEEISQFQITDDMNLIGERSDQKDNYVGSYIANCDGETGKDVVFGGASTKERNLKLYGTVHIDSGKATVRIRMNWDVVELELDSNETFETNLNLESGGNYIMVNYEDFHGTVELFSEYEAVEETASQGGEEW